MTASKKKQTSNKSQEASDENDCGICQKAPGRYKCSRCYLPYCSVACNKTHQSNHPTVVVPPPAPPPTLAYTPKPTATPADPQNPFSFLDRSDKLALLFQKYPHLPEQLMKIYSATQPPPSSAPIIGIGYQMAAPKPKKGQLEWNHDVGIRKGKEALTKAMKATGSEGEAMREYSELILYLLSGEHGDTATETIRRQNEQQDSDLIRQLLAQNK